MSKEIVPFTISQNVFTGDNYTLQISGQIEITETSDQKSHILQTIEKLARTYFSSISLVEAIKRMENDQYQELSNGIIGELSKSEIKVSNFSVLTVNASEVISELSEIDVSIDPQLEASNKGKKKGFISRLFGKK